jgi:GH25 family lysozyme M1 (1,4-beta-N-acetylmuramidase)
MVALTLALALALLPPGAAAAQRVAGIDVSRFQEEIDWERVGETRIRFAFVQASRGSGDDCAVVPDRCGPDGFYAANYRGARAAGIRVGAYHRAFAGGRGVNSARRDARAEAEVFIARVGNLREGDLLPALDVEAPFGDLSKRALRTWVRTWLVRVRRKLGERPIIYTNHSSWQATGDTTKFARAGHHLWVANWGVASPSVPADNWNGQGWSVWQYTSSGRVNGIDGSVDRNRLRVGLDKISVG